MDIKMIAPAKELDGVVKYYIIAHFHINKESGYLIKPYPPGSLQYISFYLRQPVSRCADELRGKEQQLPYSFILGPQTHRADLKFTGEVLFLGVVFWPGGLQRVVNMPMVELCDNPCNSNEVLGRDVDLLTEQLAEQTQRSEMIGIIERYLIQKLRLNKEPKRAIDAILPLILQHSEYCSIDKLIAESCLSTRQFERVFSNRVGLPAKQYLRIVRFSRAYLLKDSNPDLPWLDVALRCGYYDYAHMTKDFVEFARQTPPALRHLDTKDTETVYTAFK